MDDPGPALREAPLEAWAAMYRFAETAARDTRRFALGLLLRRRISLSQYRSGAGTPGATSGPPTASCAVGDPGLRRRSGAPEPDRARGRGCHAAEPRLRSTPATAR